MARFKLLEDGEKLVDATSTWPKFGLLFAEVIRKNRCQTSQDYRAENFGNYQN